MPLGKCPTCYGFGYVSLKHYGLGHKSYSGPLITLGPIRWLQPDYGAQLCLCPTCQTAAGKKRMAAEDYAA